MTYKQIQLIHKETINTGSTVKIPTKPDSEPFRSVSTQIDNDTYKFYTSCKTCKFYNLQVRYREVVDKNKF